MKRRRRQSPLQLPLPRTAPPEPAGEFQPATASEVADFTAWLHWPDPPPENPPANS